MAPEHEQIGRDIAPQVHGDVPQGKIKVTVAFLHAEVVEELDEEYPAEASLIEGELEQDWLLLLGKLAAQYLDIVQGADQFDDYVSVDYKEKGVDYTPVNWNDPSSQILPELASRKEEADLGEVDDYNESKHQVSVSLWLLYGCLSDQNL